MGKKTIVIILVFIIALFLSLFMFKKDDSVGSIQGTYINHSDPSHYISFDEIEMIYYYFGDLSHDNNNFGRYEKDSPNTYIIKSGFLYTAEVEFTKDGLILKMDGTTQKFYKSSTSVTKKSPAAPETSNEIFQDSSTLKVLP